MNLALNFLWVLGVEYLQNLPFILCVVFAWGGIKRGWVWWKWLAILLVGNYGCAAIIVAADWIKLLGTTLQPGAQDVASVIRIGTVFAIGTGFLLGYFILTTKLKKPFWADVVFGIIAGILSAIAETLGSVAPFLIVMHALGFAAAAASMITLIRFSADAAQGRETFIRIGLITLVMSVWIVLFDYVPHLRG